MTATVLTSATRPGLLDDVRALVRLSGPIMVAQGGLVVMGVTDTFMIGRVSAVEMGGVALGNGITFVFLVFGLGLTMGTEPLVSQAVGAGERQRAFAWYTQGLWAAALSSLPVMVLTVAALAVLPLFGVGAAVASATSSYIWFRLPSIPINALYGATRSYLTSVQRTRPVVIAVVIANVANVGLDYVFVFVLDMGAAGVGAATSICWAIMFAVVATAAHLERPAGSSTWTRPDRDRLWRIVVLGGPIGLQLTVEVGVFALVGILIAAHGDAQIAGHQIAMNLASLTFMGAVGLAVGATATVGFRIGAGQPEDARRIGVVAIVLGGAFMGLGGLIFFVLNEHLASWFSPHDPEVSAVAAGLLQIAALFAVSDGAQVVSAGALRGIGETKWPFYANVGAHWLIGLPTGVVLVERFDFGVRGYWFGLTAGLTGVAVVLTHRFLVLTRGRLARLE